MPSVIDVVLKPTRDRSVRRRHPWILSGAVDRIDGAANPGAWVRILSAEGESLGFGHLSPQSSLRVRMLSFGENPADDDLIIERIHAAIARRAAHPLLVDTEAVRLVNSEGDGLPGLIADRYGDVVVVKLSTSGMQLRRELIANAIRENTGARTGFERADTASSSLNMAHLPTVRDRFRINRQ